MISIFCIVSLIPVRFQKLWFLCIFESCTSEELKFCVSSFCLEFIIPASPLFLCIMCSASFFLFVLSRCLLGYLLLSVGCIDYVQLCVCSPPFSLTHYITLSVSRSKRDVSQVKFGREVKNKQIIQIRLKPEDFFLGCLDEYVSNVYNTTHLSADSMFRGHRPYCDG